MEKLKSQPHKEDNMESETYVKIGDQTFKAGITGILHDRTWDYRDSVSITLPMTYAYALTLFVDGIVWSIVYTDGETTTEYDYSDYCVAGDITDHRDGTVSVKMGKKTPLEKEQELRQDAETAAKILLGEEA